MSIKEPGVKGALAGLASDRHEPENDFDPNGDGMTAITDQQDVCGDPKMTGTLPMTSNPALDHQCVLKSGEYNCETSYVPGHDDDQTVLSCDLGATGGNDGAQVDPKQCMPVCIGV